jgi:hypothetical protein
MHRLKLVKEIALRVLDIFSREMLDVHLGLLLTSCQISAKQASKNIPMTRFSMLTVLLLP